jgi:septal ring-binding cell division protein DamX
MNLPTERYFTISYRLIPKNQAKLEAPRVKGNFSYMVEDKTISMPIVQRDADLMNLTVDEVGNLVTDVKSNPVDLPVEEPALVAVVETATLKEEPLKEEPEKVETVKEEPARAETKTRKPKDNGSLSYSLEPESGVYYRVQVAAGHKAVNVDRYFKKYNLGKEVRKELHEGWHKYSIGSFMVYKEARDYRVHLWNTTPVKDAFVSAYNSGKRITVQEALMITEQQWYQ